MRAARLQQARGLFSCKNQRPYAVLYIVCYDIADPKRLYRVARVCEAFGLRLQDSVYQCWLQPGQLSDLTAKLKVQMDLERDTVRVYPVCGNDCADMRVFGLAQKPRPPESTLLI